MIRFKFNVYQELKNKGFNTVKIRNETKINESALQKIRRGEVPGLVTINYLCALLKKQPGQLLEFIPDETSTDDLKNRS